MSWAFALPLLVPIAERRPDDNDGAVSGAGESNTMKTGDTST